LPQIEPTSAVLERRGVMILLKQRETRYMAREEKNTTHQKKKKKKSKIKLKIWGQNKNKTN